MILRAWAPAALIAASLVMGLESSSEACSLPAPGLMSSIPMNGEGYPSNAAIFLLGYEVSLDGVTVTVDGAPATLVPADKVAPLGLAALAVLVSPAPAVGQSVEIKGDFCPPAYMCTPAAFTFVASEADTAAPPAPSAISFDIHDYPDFKSGGGDCQSDSDLAWWITATGEPGTQSESLVILTIEAFRDAGEKDLAYSMSTFLGSTDTTVVLRRTIDFLAGAAAQDALCFRATTSDASGNKDAASVSSCKPCNYRKDSSPAMSDWPPSEPEWTAADAFPGGPCSAGAGAGGGGGSAGAGGADGNDDVTIGGCGCRLEGGDGGPARPLEPAGAALAAIALLAVARRRRR